MKTKLVDFDIEKAQTGAKVVTRDGERARIICYDRVDDTDVKYPIVALVMGKIMKCECVQYYTIKGEWNGYRKSCKDLMIDVDKIDRRISSILFSNVNGYPSNDLGSLMPDYNE